MLVITIEDQRKVFKLHTNWSMKVMRWGDLWHLLQGEKYTFQQSEPVARKTVSRTPNDLLIISEDDVKVREQKCVLVADGVSNTAFLFTRQ